MAIQEVLNFSPLPKDKKEKIFTDRALLFHLYSGLISIDNIYLFLVEKWRIDVLSRLSPSTHTHTDSHNPP